MVSDMSSELGPDGSRSPKTGMILDRIIDIKNTERTYDLFVPENQRNSPVVILLHAHRSNSKQMLGDKGTPAPYKVWLDIASKNNLVLVIPNGVVGPDDETGWNDCRTDAGNPNIDDVTFIRQTVDAVGGDYSIDRKKIFATGTSNGGHMAIRLAQDAPEMTAAIAVVAALMPVNSACDENQTPISALFIHGSADRIAPYEGGEMKGDRGQIFSAEDTIAYWVRRNTLTTAPQTTSLPNLDTRDRSTVEKTYYKGGKNGTEFVHLKVIGGGHIEPSIAQEYRAGFEIFVGKQNHDFEMADEVWAFFENKAKP